MKLARVKTKLARINTKLASTPPKHGRTNAASAFAAECRELQTAERMVTDEPILDDGDGSGEKIYAECSRNHSLFLHFSGRAESRGVLVSRAAPRRLRTK
jgi:hypothetical protein